MRFHLTGIHGRPRYLPLGKPQVSVGRTPPILRGCGGVTSLCDGSQLQRGWGRERRGAADTREGLFLGPTPPPAASVCPPPTVTRGPFFLPMLPLLHLRRSWGRTWGASQDTDIGKGSSGSSKGCPPPRAPDWKLVRPGWPHTGEGTLDFSVARGRMCWVSREACER